MWMNKIIIIVKHGVTKRYTYNWNTYNNVAVIIKTSVRRLNALHMYNEAAN